MTSASIMGCPRTRRLPSFCSSAMRVICFALSPYAASAGQTIGHMQLLNLDTGQLLFISNACGCSSMTLYTIAALVGI